MNGIPLGPAVLGLDNDPGRSREDRLTPTKAILQVDAEDNVVERTGPIETYWPGSWIYAHEVIGIALAEHVRAGFASIGHGQYDAVLSTGMTRLQMYWYVMIPHALRLIIPPLTTEFLTIFKNSAVAMTIGVAETTFMSYKIDEQTFHGLEATTGAMAIYLVLGMTVVKLMDLVEARFRIPGLMSR